MFMSETETRNLRFGYGGCSESAIALGDRERIVQLCVALLTNAKKATPAYGDVRLQCRAAGRIRSDGDASQSTNPETSARMAAVPLPRAAVLAMTAVTRPSHEEEGIARCSCPPHSKPLFGFISRNAGSMAEFLHIPPDRSVELGTTVAL